MTQLEGKKTCFHYNSSSVVDYVIGSKSILRNVQYLIVNPLMPHLSDHCHLSFAIKASIINRDSLESSAELILTEYNRLSGISSLRKDLRMVSNQVRGSYKR